MNEVKIGSWATRKVAATWNELSREQLLRLMPILYGLYPDPIRQRLDTLVVVLGITPALLLRFTAVQLVEIKWLTDFLFEDHVGLTRQLLPWLSGRWYQRRLYGPADTLSNLRFLEFVFADSYFLAYAQSQDAQWLDKLVATLYRPQRRPYRPLAADFGGDRRQDFNENLTASRLARVAKLSQAAKLAVLTWYRGCRHALELRFPLVFTPDNEDKASTHTGGWGYVLREMSGGAFGSYEETARQHATEVLAKMEDDSHRAQELQRQADAQKTSY